MVNATAIVGAARRLAKKKRVEGVSFGFRLRFRFRNRQSAGPQRGRRPGPASLDHLGLQSTLLGLAAGVEFKLCPFGGEHPFIGWLCWAVGFHQHRPSPARFGTCREILSCSLDCDIAPLRIRGIRVSRANS